MIAPPSPPDDAPGAERTWKIAYRVFQQALEMAPQERRAFAQSATDDQDVLRVLLEFIEQAEAELQGEDSSNELEPDLEAGARFGRYEIHEKLGRGGMGQVYSARDTELGRMVALKLLAPDVAPTPKALERLMREAKAASALNHPHIVTVYEVIRDGTSLAVAMELVEGEPLRKYCGAPQPAAQTIHWGQQIAKALAATHERGVVHRDIKPENLMLRSDGFVKLLDFGLARQTLSSGPQTNMSGMLAGTFNYMSPEQTRGEPVSEASDVFSLGIVLYELATGTHPFRMGSAIDTAQAIAHKNPKPPLTLKRSIPPALNTLLLSMLAKDPKRRPTASEVDQRLGKIDPTEVRPRRLMGIVMAALVLCITAGAAWITARGWHVPAQNLKFTQITTQDAEHAVTVAALSPDGSSLAFATWNGEIQLRRMSDGVTRSLNAPREFHPERIAWFSNGRQLLVSGSLDLDLRPEIWEVSTGTDPPRRIFADVMNGMPAPDGVRIAVTDTNGTTIWVIDASSGSRKYVRGGKNTIFTSLTWSPDGKRVSYQRQDYAPLRDQQVDARSSRVEKSFTYSYESVEVETGRLVASLADVVMNSSCSLPDGRVLFLRSAAYEQPDGRDIWELRTDPHTGKLLGPPRALTSGNTRHLSYISAAADGKKIAVLYWPASFPRMSVADLPPPGKPMRFLNVRTLTLRDDFPHAWSADNREIIFESTRNGTRDLFRQPIDERNAKPLVEEEGEDVLPQLSPDGQWVLYRNTTEKGGKRLMRVPYSGGEPEPVPTRTPWDEFRCPSRQGKSCVLRSVVNDQFIFYELDPVRGQGRELARTLWTPTILGDWGLSPDGNEIAIPNHDLQEAKVRLVRLGGETLGMEESSVTLNGLTNLIAVEWAADGQGWFVCVGRGFSIAPQDGRLLLYVDRKGPTSLLVRSPGVLYAVPSRNGRHVAFPEERSPSNVWMVDGT